MRNKESNLKKVRKRKFFNNLPISIPKLLRYFIKTNKNPEVIPPLKSIKEKSEVTFAFSDVEKANLLSSLENLINDCFAFISTLNEVDATLPTFSLKTQNSLNNIQIQESEIVDVIKNVKKIACGEDQIFHCTLKKIRSTVTIPPKMLFTRSLSECPFPS